MNDLLDLISFLNEGETQISNLVLKNYKQLGMTDIELVFFIQLVQFQQQNDLFPDLSIIAERMNIEVTQVFNLAQSLIDKGIISLQTQRTKEGKTADLYNINSIYEKLDVLKRREETKQEFTSREESIKDLHQQFEKEFGRLLSPIEIETINLWISEDNYDVDVIRLALKEAVLNQAYSLKYIDRVLISWERKNLKTSDQINQELRQRKKILLEKPNHDYPVNKNIPKVPLYDWLHPEKNETD